MVGLMLLCLLSIAIPPQEQEIINLPYQINQLSIQLRSLEENVQQKELFILEQDNKILHLQRRLQGVKAAQSNILLKRNQGELSTLQDQIRNLMSDIDRRNFEYQQLEDLSTNNKQHLDGVQQTLHTVEEQITQAQAHGDQNNGISDGGTWPSTIINMWKREFWEILALLKEKISHHVNIAQECAAQEVQAGLEVCKTFVTTAIRTLGSHSIKVNSTLQPYLSKLNQQLSKGLKYGINNHLQLQRTIRKSMQRNRYLASKESREVVWFLASALLIIPLWGALKLSSFLEEGERSSVARTNVHQRRRHAIQLRLMQA